MQQASWMHQIKADAGTSCTTVCCAEIVIFSIVKPKLGAVNYSQLYWSDALTHSRRA